MPTVLSSLSYIIAESSYLSKGLIYVGIALTLILIWILTRHKFR
jgi:hypothetical protein